MFENYSEFDRPMLQSAYNVITNMEKWSFLKEYQPPQDKGFMWDDNETVIEMTNLVKFDNVSTKENYGKKVFQELIN